MTASLRRVPRWQASTSWIGSWAPWPPSSALHGSTSTCTTTHQAFEENPVTWKAWPGLPSCTARWIGWTGDAASVALGFHSEPRASSRTLAYQDQQEPMQRD